MAWIGVGKRGYTYISDEGRFVLAYRDAMWRQHVDGSWDWGNWFQVWFTYAVWVLFDVEDLKATLNVGERWPYVSRVCATGGVVYWLYSEGREWRGHWGESAELAEAWLDRQARPPFGKNWVEFMGTYVDGQRGHSDRVA